MTKTNLCIAASVALLLAACSADTTATGDWDEAVPQPTPLTFDTYIPNAAVSRAGQTGLMNKTLLGAKGFGVFAYWTDNGSYTAGTSKPNFMYNQQVKRKTDETGDTYTWEYSPLKYWPNETDNDSNGASSGERVDRLSFFAYAPYVGDLSTGKLSDGETEGITKITPTKSSEAGDPVISFKVPADPKDNVDLLWGVVPKTETEWSTKTWGNVTGDNLTIDEGKPYIDLIKPSVTETVQFQFRHALARIALKIRGVFDETTPGDKEIDGSTKITVNSVTMSGQFGNSGQLNLNNSVAGKPNWTNVKDKDNNDVSATNPATLNITSSGLNSAITSSGQGVKKTADDVMAKNGDSDTYFMVIPAAAAGEVKFEIDYDVTTTDSHLEGNKVTVNNKISKTLSSQAIEAGNAYTFTLLLGMTSLKVSADVAEWSVTGTEVNVDLPKNKE